MPRRSRACSRCSQAESHCCRRRLLLSTAISSHNKLSQSATAHSQPHPIHQPAMSSSSGAPPSLDSVHQMKQFLTANRVSFADCVEKADLVRRVQETQAKIAAQPPQQAKACDCMQGAPHSHDAAAAAAAASSSAASKAKKEGGAIVRHIPVGPLQCNMTIIADPVTKHALLVDPGGDADKIIALIKEMGVTIKQILVTHAHFDHFLAAEEIRKHTGAPVGLSAKDNMLWQALPLQCMMLGQPAPKEAIGAPDFDLTDGLELSVRGGRVIHTPGHSPGSCCFYFADDSLVCTGDTLFRQSVGRTDLMGGDSAALVRSIQTRLYTLPPDTHVIPGHGPTTDIGFEMKHNGVVKAAKAASL